MCDYILDTNDYDNTHSRQSALQILQEIIQIRNKIEKLRAKESHPKEEVKQIESEINKFVKK